MPIYMDVHRNLNANPEEVAMAHSLDLEVQSKYGVHYTREAHGLVAEQLIEVTMDHVDAFLGAQKPTPSGTDPNDGGFRVVMFTDIVGSTALGGRLGDQLFHDVLKTHNAVMREALRSHSGTEIKHTGDGILSSFLSVEQGVECAMTIQKNFAEYNLQTAAQTILVRVDMSAGEPVSDNRDLFGVTVNLAARVCAFAQPSQILTSNVIRSASRLCSQRSAKLS
jgi:class 3 adenylate cyclase